MAYKRTLETGKKMYEIFNNSIRDSFLGNKGIGSYKNGIVDILKLYIAADKIEDTEGALELVKEQSGINEAEKAYKLKEAGLAAEALKLYGEAAGKLENFMLSYFGKIEIKDEKLKELKPEEIAKRNLQLIIEEILKKQENKK